MVVNVKELATTSVRLAATPAGAEVAAGAAAELGEAAGLAALVVAAGAAGGAAGAQAALTKMPTTRPVRARVLGCKSLPSGRKYILIDDKDLRRSTVPVLPDCAQWPRLI